MSSGAVALRPGGSLPGRNRSLSLSKGDATPTTGCENHDMTQVIVAATAVQRLSDEPPGRIEVEIVDAAGRVHRLVITVPERGSRAITAATDVPFRLGLRAEYVRMEGEAVEVRFADGVTTTEGLGEMRLDTDIVHWL